MADKILVTLGMKCPRPLFEVSKTLRDMETGQTLEVSADDPAFKLDIEAWCRRTGNVLVDFKSLSDRMVATIQKH